MLRRSLLAAIGLLVSAGLAAAQATPPSQPPAAATTDTSTSQESMEDPQVGDHWTYELRDDITGDIKSTFTNTITDVSTTDITVRVTVVGNPNTGFVSYDRSWNRTGNDTFRFTPNDGSGIRSPLAVGKTWSTKSNDLNTSAGVGWKRSVKSKVVAQESVTTRAGTFDTFKIEISFVLQSTKDATKKAQDELQAWYAPAIDHWVKQTSVMRSEGRVRNRTTAELIEYGRR
jgi:hypothetical protein